MPEKYYPHFSGNIYVQNNFGIFAYWQNRSGAFGPVMNAHEDLERFVKEELGDKTGVVLSPSMQKGEQTEQRF